MNTPERRYDVDWLRVIAIALLLIYHTAIGFQPWGLLIGFIQSEEPLPALWVPMAMLNVWRIPLLFFVSGMGVYFALRKRNGRQLLVERARRILLPFVFGLLTIVPLHVFILQDYYNLELSYQASPGHLWFLGNIFVYVLIMLPAFSYLKKNEAGNISRKLKWVFGTPWGLLLMVAAFWLEVRLVNPAAFEQYAMTWHGFFLGLLAFVSGFLCVYSGEAFRQLTLKWRWLFLGIGLILYLLRISFFHFKSPQYLIVIESNAWIFAAFGFAAQYLNRQSKILTYLSRGAYPIYIIHMAVLYAASWLIFPLKIPILFQLVLVVSITLTGCVILYEFVIRRVPLLGPLFGLKDTANNPAPVGFRPGPG